MQFFGEMLILVSIMFWAFENPKEFFKTIASVFGLFAMWLAYQLDVIHFPAILLLLKVAVAIFVIAGSIYVFCIPYLVWKSWPK